MASFPSQRSVTSEDTQSLLALIQQWAHMNMDFVLDIHQSTVAVSDKTSALIIAFDQIHVAKCREQSPLLASDEDLATAVVHGAKLSFIEELPSGRVLTSLLELKQDVRADLVLHSLADSSLILKVPFFTVSPLKLCNRFKWKYHLQVSHPSHLFH